jgi:hypothetical protein
MYVRTNTAAILAKLTLSSLCATLRFIWQQQAMFPVTQLCTKYTQGSLTAVIYYRAVNWYRLRLENNQDSLSLYTKHTNTLRRQNIEILRLKLGGTYSKHRL